MGVEEGAWGERGGVSQVVFQGATSTAAVSRIQEACQLKV